MFAYDGNQKLAQVTAPAVAGAPRNVTASMTSGRLITLTDPDGFVTTFAHSPTVTNVMMSRRDKHNQSARLLTMGRAVSRQPRSMPGGSDESDHLGHVCRRVTWRDDEWRVWSVHTTGHGECPHAYRWSPCGGRHLEYRGESVWGREPDP